MDRSFVFCGPDLVRAIDGPVGGCIFVSEHVRDVKTDGRERREVFFGNRQTTGSAEGHSEFQKARELLLVDVVLESGVTQEFLLRRIGERQAEGRCGWRCCWTRLRSGAWPWNLITLASRPHLIYCGLVRAGGVEWPGA